MVTIIFVQTVERKIREKNLSLYLHTMMRYAQSTDSDHLLAWSAHV